MATHRALGTHPSRSDRSECGYNAAPDLAGRRPPQPAVLAAGSGRSLCGTGGNAGGCPAALPGQPTARCPRRYRDHRLGPVRPAPGGRRGRDRTRPTSGAGGAARRLQPRPGHLRADRHSDRRRSGHLADALRRRRADRVRAVGRTSRVPSRAAWIACPPSPGRRSARTPGGPGWTPPGPTTRAPPPRPRFSTCGSTPD